MLMDRRCLLAGSAASLVSLPVLAQPKLTFDFTKPRDNLLAYLKLQCSLANEDVWQWFTGKFIDLPLQ